PAARDLGEALQLTLRRPGGARRFFGRTEAGSRRRGHERIGLDGELAPEEVAELAERGAARRLDPLVDEERGELLPAGGGDTARITPRIPSHAKAELGQHDPSDRRREAGEQKQYRPAAISTATAATEARHRRA